MNQQYVRMLSEYLAMQKYDTLVLLGLYENNLTPRDISQYTSVPRNKVYNSLINLAALGFILPENYKPVVLTSAFRDRVSKLLEESNRYYSNFINEVLSEWSKPKKNIKPVRKSKP